MSNWIELTSGSTRVRVAPGAGGRVASIEVGGVELLAGSEELGEKHPLLWGIYPMVPWPGRLGLGELHFDGAVHRFPLDMPPHAIHGTTWDVPWSVSDAGAAHLELRVELTPPWPFGGHAFHRIAVADDGVRLELEVVAGEVAMPAACGWHPWFRRDIGGGVLAALSFEAGRMWQRGDDGLPTRSLVPSPPGPWDDCFTDVTWPATITWPGVGTLSVASDCDHMVIYDELADALCIEPQTLPPDGLNHAPPVLAPGQSLSASMSMKWAPA